MKNILTPYVPTGKKDSSIVVIYGSADSGKSSLALTLTKSHKTAYFDIERMALDRFIDLPSKNINASNLYDMGVVDSLDQILKFIESPVAQSVDVVVIDSMTHLLNKMTAHANPATLKGNAVFGYYRDLGRYATFICEKAREKKVNLVITAQAIKDKKGYEGVYVPDITGKETIDTLRDLSDIMVLIEKTGFGKRTIWQDADNSFCLTKSKGLPADHKEKISIEGLEKFNFDSLVEEKPLYIKPAPKKAPKELLKKLDVAIKESDKLEKLDTRKLLSLVGKEKMADLLEKEAELLLEKVAKRTAMKKKLQDLKAQTK